MTLRVLFTALRSAFELVFHHSHFSRSNVHLWQNIHWVHKCTCPFALGKHLAHLRLCKRQFCSILKCWNTCALVGGLVLTGQCAVSHPRRFTAPPWLPQGENPSSLDIWATRLWDIWIVGLQDNRDIGLWDMREVERLGYLKLIFWMFEILAFRLMGSLFNSIYALLLQMSQTMHFLHRLFASNIAVA